MTTVLRVAQSSWLPQKSQRGRGFRRDDPQRQNEAIFLFLTDQPEMLLGQWPMTYTSCLTISSGLDMAFHCVEVMHSLGTTLPCLLSSLGSDSALMTSGKAAQPSPIISLLFH